MEVPLMYTLGKPYWNLRINSYKLEKKVSAAEYRSVLKQLQFDLKHNAKGKLDFKTEEEANKAFSKLPKYLQEAAVVQKATPVYGLI
jgi:hypothetical protein